MTFQASEDLIRAILRDVLGLSAERVAALDAESGLFGFLPEFDSLAVATVIGEIEDRLGIRIDNDEIDADVMGSLGALIAFVEAKRA